jgi:thiamine transporter ThiT
LAWPCRSSSSSGKSQTQILGHPEGLPASIASLVEYAVKAVSVLLWSTKAPEGLGALFSLSGNVQAFVSNKVKAVVLIVVKLLPVAESMTCSDPHLEAARAAR